VRADEGREGRGQQPERARVGRSAEPLRAGGDRRLDRARQELRVDRHGGGGGGATHLALGLELACLAVS